MNINFKNIYFIGIGGIGMSALARYFKMNDCYVAGYDITQTQLTDDLSKIGIEINYEDSIDSIPKDIINNKEETLVIYTPAVPKNHVQLNYFIDNSFEVYKRAEILGLLSRNSKTIAIAGTHGKTSISSLVTHILKENNLLKAGFVGGIIKNYNSNFIFGDNSLNNWLVLEADEFDRSFHNLNPDISLISSTDADHLDIYVNKKNFADAFNIFASKTKDVIISNSKADISIQKNIKKFTYNTDGNCDFSSQNIRFENQKQVFDIIYPQGICKDVTIIIPGKVNVENSVAAFAVCFVAGVNPENIKKSISTFNGVQRRFDIIVKSEKVIYINDYAHHPTEIDSLREAVRQMCPGKKLTVVFQPHLFSRTRDFAHAFAESLSKFDEIFLMDIYPARELPIEGVTSEIIFNAISNKNKQMCTLQNTIGLLQKHDFEVLLTVGAGNILNLVEPLKKLVIKKYNL